MIFKLPHLSDDVHPFQSCIACVRARLAVPWESNDGITDNGKGIITKSTPAHPRVTSIRVRASSRHRTVCMSSYLGGEESHQKSKA
jgi:hypothetical protein